MWRKAGSIVFLIVALVLVGCAGDKELHSLVLIAGSSAVEPNMSTVVTVSGAAADGSRVKIEPISEGWVLVTEAAGTLAPDPDDPGKAQFTAAAGYYGDAIVKYQYEGLEAEITLRVSELVIVGAKAWDFVDQGPGDSSQNYLNSPNSDDHNGVRAIDDTRGYAANTAFSHWNWNGHWLKWKLDVPQAGEYALVLRYATKEDSQYTKRALTIDGEQVLPGPIELPGTGGFAGSGAVDQWGYQVVRGINIEQAKEIELVLAHAGTPGERKGTNLAYLALVSPAEFAVDDDFLIRIEEAIGVERIKGAW
ncbi:MAG: hypothetical protein GX228_03120 [Firmicutes bacterium]|jgi:hypothetical protein|nr:hypothetical protein [Bacillota bacterium]NLL87911.1 hypothetical protein [Bacillota bacterium]HKM18109.1 hypothetical protein [Limnochordia bacterium]